MWRIQAQILLNATRNEKPFTFSLDEGSASGIELEIKAPWGTFVPNLPESGDLNEVSDLRAKFLKYMVNPNITRGLETDRMMDSPVVVFELMNAMGEVMQFNNTNRANKTGLIELVFPYDDGKKLDLEGLQCMSMDDKTGKFSTNDCGIHIYDSDQCLNCTGISETKKTAICYCSKLSGTFALIFDQGAYSAS